MVRINLTKDDRQINKVITNKLRYYSFEYLNYSYPTF